MDRQVEGRKDGIQDGRREGAREGRDRKDGRVINQ